MDKFLSTVSKEDNSSSNENMDPAPPHNGAKVDGNSIHLINAMKTVQTPTGKLNPLSKQSLILYALIVMAALCSFSAGYDIRFTDAFNPGNSAKVTGIIFSIYPLGQVPGSLVASAICDRWGRRSSLFVGSVMVIVATTMLTTSHTLGQFLAGRFLLGAGISFTDIAAPTYCIEIAPPQDTAPYPDHPLLNRGRRGVVLYGCTYMGDKNRPIEFSSVITDPNDAMVAHEISEIRSKIHIGDGYKECTAAVTHGYHDGVFWTSEVQISGVGLGSISASLSGFSAKWASFGIAAASAFFLFSAVYSFTYTPLQSLYCVECLETTARAKGMTLKTLVINIGSFISLYAIPLGFAHLQLVFVFINVIEAILWYFLCVETVGRTLEELDDIFNEKNPAKASQFNIMATVGERS
ncbi:major facilitator superfamily domain-containing protein [Hysterangium stoloniferum]|nr:major facilitator superfamily domain-containing protein [Hysterangium stoloniferum]